MATGSHGAHLKDATQKASHLQADPAGDNPYLVAAREADRNLRTVSIALAVMVVTSVVATYLLSGVGTHAGAGARTASVEFSVAPAVTSAGQLVLQAEEDALELALWEADPENIRTDADATLETATSEHGVESSAPEGFVQTGASAQLDQAIADFESRGYVLGFALVDVETGRTIAYNADEPRYPASSIKAAFCTFVYETNGPVSEGAVKTCIVDSSNDAYHSLIRTYGQQAFSEWLMPMAPDAAGNAAAHFYPWISPNEFLVVWQEIYRYCSSDEPGAAELAGYLGSTTTTAWGELFRDDWEVWAKAGWYPSTTERATCDCGVVFSDCGPYVVVVMSDAPEDFEALKPVLDALNVAHGKMCGGSTDSRLPAA